MMVPLMVLLAAAEPTKDQPSAAAVTDQDRVVSEVEDGDPFADPSSWGSTLGKIPQQRLGESRETLNLRLEVWEMETKELVLEMDALKEADAVADWRLRLLKGQARLVHAPVLSLEAKSRGDLNSTIERIYPTEYEPPEVLPAEAVESLLDADKPTSLGDLIEKMATAATPTAFETRNTGVSLEAEIQPVSAEEGCWDVSISLEDTQQVGLADYGDEELHLQMPIFATFRTGGLLRVKGEHWQLLSAMSAPRLPDQPASDKTWVTLVRIDPGR